MNRTNTYFGFSIMLFVVVGVLILLVIKGMGPVLNPHNADMSDEAIAERIKPVAQLNTGDPIAPPAPKVAQAAASSGPRSGEAVFNSACTACHSTGAAGAPKIGDSAAWAPRIDKGMDALMKSALNGLNAMPPRGTCGNCSDDELKNAIEYMISKSK